MLNKIWFIKVDGSKEGPYSLHDLKKHPRMTPDTLVWKEGFNSWLPARKVPDLKSLFEDERETPVVIHERFKLKSSQGEDATISLEGSNYPFLFFWIFVLIVAIVYLYYEFTGF